MTYKPVTIQRSVATYDPEALRRYMVGQTNERLLAIVTQERAEYIQPALNLAEAELRLRGVPFPVPSAPRQVSISKRWGADTVDGTIFTILVLLSNGIFIPLWYFLSGRFTWLSSAFIWFLKMALGGLIASLTIATLFWWAEYLLAKWRRIHHHP